MSVPQTILRLFAGFVFPIGEFSLIALITFFILLPSLLVIADLRGSLGILDLEVLEIPMLLADIEILDTVRWLFEHLIILAVHITTSAGLAREGLVQEESSEDCNELHSGIYFHWGNSDLKGQIVPKIFFHWNVLHKELYMEDPFTGHSQCRRNPCFYHDKFSAAQSLPQLVLFTDAVHAQCEIAGATVVDALGSHFLLVQAACALELVFGVEWVCFVGL